jgi:hypothetical protein
MRTFKSILGSVIGGAIITLITGLYSSGLIGATRYGLPLTWLIRRVLAPQYNPWRISVVGLVVDIVIWAVLIELAFLATRSMGKGAPAKSAAKTRRRRRKS